MAQTMQRNARRQLGHCAVCFRVAKEAGKGAWSNCQGDDSAEQLGYPVPSGSSATLRDATSLG